jgi:hypothetical protein
MNLGAVALFKRTSVMTKRFYAAFGAVLCFFGLTASALAERMSGSSWNFDGGLRG